MHAFAPAVALSGFAPLRLSGLEPLVIDEHTLFVNVGERTNVSGSKAFDVQWLIELLQAQGVPIVISQRPALSIDEHMYLWPHLIENFFGKLKEFKRFVPYTVTRPMPASRR